MVLAMLKFLRRNTKSVIWSVIIAFVLWGGFTFSTQLHNEGRIAGKVFGKDVNFQEFNRFYRASELFSFQDKPVSDPNEIKRAAWEKIILSREAKRRKIDVSDDEVRNEVIRLLEKQKIFNPEPAVYKHWLQSELRETPQEFEAQIREIVRIQKLLFQIHNALPGGAEPKEGEEKTKHAEAFTAWTKDLLVRAHLEDYIPT